MCTVTFVPHEQGYRFAVNRDERRMRAAALPPRTFDVGGVRAVYPHESSGGTWVAASERGIALTLLNWNAGPRGPKLRSRGEVIPQLIRYVVFADAERVLAALDLTGIEPFRLVGAFPREHLLCEWRWDRVTLRHELPPWQPRHWFSSGLSDEDAAQQRGTVTAAAWKEEDAGSLAWMRRLHRSHAPAPGPFSLCVHRDDARTVSYTEIEAAGGTVSLCYQPGSPCAPEGPPACVALPIV